MTIETTFVGDVADFIRGITFKPDQLVELDDCDAVVCMRTKNVQRDLDDSDLIAVPRSIIRNKEKFLREGDILISSANSWELVGKCSYVQQLSYPATAGGFIGIVRPKEGITHPRFFYHWLNSSRTQHNVRNLGRQTTNISNLNVNRFKELELPKFKYPEQSRIAAILDRADSIRRKREQFLSSAQDALIALYFDVLGDPVLNTFNFEECRLDSISDITSGLTKGRKTKGNILLRSVPYMRVANVQDGYLDLSEVKEIEATTAEIDRYRLVSGDLLLTEGGDPDKLGRGCVWNEEIEECIHQNHIFRVRLNSEDIDPYVLQVQMGSQRGKRYFLQAAKQTTGIASINKKQLSAYPVLIPDGNRQLKFILLSEKLRSVVSKAEADLTNSEEFFDSLSQRAFRGEL